MRPGPACPTGKTELSRRRVTQEGRFLAVAASQHLSCPGFLQCECMNYSYGQRTDKQTPPLVEEMGPYPVLSRVPGASVCR